MPAGWDIRRSSSRNNEEVIQKFGDVINAGRIIVNSPGSIGALGGVYNDMVPTFSFGCGTGGGNSTTDNVNVYHYLNIKRVARRTQAHMWFRVPNQIYFNMNAVENLRNFPSRSTLIITNAGAGADRPRRRRPALHPAGDAGARDHHSRRRARHQDHHAGRGGAELLQGRPDHRAGRRLGHRRGQDHEAEVRVAGGRPGRTGRAVPRHPQARGAIPDGKDQPGAADRHLHHQRNRQRSHAVRRA